MLSTTWAILALCIARSAYAAPQGVSQSARCGASVRLTCLGSTFGDCCSTNGWCGSTDVYCGTGCQAGWGRCGTGSTPALKVSTNAQCGGNTGFTCAGSSFGNCCSKNGWCGSSNDYCGSGCNPSAGRCGQSQATPSPSPASPAPSPNGQVSSNGRCGTSNNVSPKGMTCKGSRFGNCCSKYSYCGSSKDHCGTGCQSGFGDCDAKASSSPAASPTPIASRSSSMTFSSSSFSSSSSPSPSPIPQTPICGSKLIPNNAQTTYYTAVQESLEQCTQTCLSEPSCLYFLSSTTGICYLYNRFLERDRLTVLTATTSLYERTCFPASSPAVSMSTVVSSTPNAMPSPTPMVAAPVCNRKEYPVGTMPFAYNAQYANSLQACGQRCVAATACTYVIFSDTDCLLYALPYYSNGLQTYDSTITLSQKACFI